MPEIGTSGSMSGDGKRSDGHRPQATAPVLLRLASQLLTEARIRICAPLHDAFLIEARTSEIGDTVGTVQRLMAEASEIVLDGFTLRAEAKIFRHPGRYHDSRGEVMWGAAKAVLRTGQIREPVRRRHVP